MCKRMVTCCLMCAYTTMNLNPCKKWGSDAVRNIFGSGWMKEHVSRNRNNLINSLRIVICNRCAVGGMVVEQPGFDSANRKLIDKTFTRMSESLLGVTELRLAFPGYVIFF